MNTFVVLPFLLSAITLSSCRIYSGLNSANSAFDPANTGEGLQSNVAGPDQNINNPTVESRGLLGPHLEILQLLETFVRFKGELGSRIQALFVDNRELIQSVYMTVVSKIGTLHTFTLTGITILRKVLELANSLMAQWQINLPSVGVDVNVAHQNGQGALFHFMKNANTFRG